MRERERERERKREREREKERERLTGAIDKRKIKLIQTDPKLRI